MASDTFELSWHEVHRRAQLVGRSIWDDLAGRAVCIRIYGVPRGGVPVAAMLADRFAPEALVEDPAQANVLVDDLIDSGATRAAYLARYPGARFYALLDKQAEGMEGTWVSFPWERMQGEQGPEDAVTRLLQYVGEDPGRDGLKETPARVARSLKELTAGYGADVSALFKTFDASYDEMVLVRRIGFTSLCEHHLLPFLGYAHVAYIPNGRVVGLSKLARLVDAYARRLQLQERLTEEVTRALDTYLHPQGSACVIEARHSCMGCRGVRKEQAVMVTSSLTGAFRQPAVRAEFMSLLKG